MIFIIQFEDFCIIFPVFMQEIEEKQGCSLESFIIITTKANTLLAKIHDRTPVIIKPEQYGLWLAPHDKGTGVKELFRPYDPFKMTAYPVSGMCNNPKYDAPGCIKRVDN